VLVRRRPAPLAAALAAAALGCGGVGTTTALTVSPTPYLVTLGNYGFDPPALMVPAGGTVLFQNDDYMEHWIESAPAAGVFSHAAVGGVDLELLVPSRGAAPFTVPTSAAVGTSVSLYVREWGAATEIPGSLTIAPAATGP
jgi:plastocyanin